MWQRFTERARRVILLAQEEAGKMNSSHVGTEHLLLGLARENDGAAAQVLTKMGVSPQHVRQEIEAEIGQPEEPSGNEPKLTPRAKRVLELAADESRRMRLNYIGTEHLLIALLREKDGVAANVLRKLGLKIETVRTQVESYVGSGPEDESTQSQRPKFAVIQPTPTASEIRSRDYESTSWMWTLMVLLLPRNLREQAIELRRLNEKKKTAIDRDDYEAAAILRDEAQEIERRMKENSDEWAKAMDEDVEALTSPSNSLKITITTLITQIEAAIEALQNSDEAKLSDVKQNLAALREQLRDPGTDDSSDSGH